LKIAYCKLIFHQLFSAECLTVKKRWRDEVILHLIKPFIRFYNKPVFPEEVSATLA
jgi:hypothetical protein